MKPVPLAKVELDGKGRLLLYPAGERYDYIYRAAAGVTWEPQGQFLHFGDPRGLTYPVCFQQIISVVASEYGHHLALSKHTEWINVPADLRNAIETSI